MAEPFLSEIRLMSFDFAPQGLGAVQRAVAADQPEPGAVLAARHDVRRRRPRQLRAAGPARARADPRRQRPHARRARRRAGAHADAAPSCRRTCTRCVAPPAMATRRSAPARCSAASGAVPAYGAATNLTALLPGSVDQHRRQPGAPEHAAVPDPHLLHRAAGHLPLPDLKEQRRWLNPTSARSACSRATSRRRAGCSATAQLLPISENETLFNLIGTTYGGDGQSTFAPARPARPRCRCTRATGSSLARDRRRRKRSR